MSIERDSSCCVIASRSASSTMTNSPLATSQPFTISSGPTSRSCVGHQRFWRIGVLHSRWSVRKLTSDCFAFGVVARARPTGMLTRPKLIDPFQMVRMGPLPKSVVGPAPFAAICGVSCSGYGGLGLTSGLLYGPEPESPAERRAHGKRRALQAVWDDGETDVVEMV